MELAIDHDLKEPEGFRQLFQSIVMFESYEAFEDLVQEMSRRLARLFDNIEEQNGVKMYRKSLTYYPNGLCKSGSMSVILEPWEARTKAEEKKPAKPKKVRIPYYLVHQVNPFWGFQVREYLKKSYAISFDDKFPVVDLLEKLDIYNGLDEKEQNMVSRTEFDRKAWSIFSEFHRAMQHSHGDFDHCDSDFRTFRFLTDEELERVSTYLVENAATLKAYELENYLQSHVDFDASHERIIDFSDLTSCHTPGPTPEEMKQKLQTEMQTKLAAYNDHWFAGEIQRVVYKKHHYDITNEYDSMEAITCIRDVFNQVEDPMIRKIAYRLGIIETNKR